MKFDILHIAEYGTLNEMKEAIKEGSDINIEDKDEGGTSLMGAIAYENTDIALFLINNGADVMAQDNEDYNALHYAAMHNNLAVAQAILEVSTDPLHVEDIHKSQPLYRALRDACEEPFEMIKLFLDKGADKNHGNLSEWIKIYNIDELTKLFERY